MLHLNNIWSGDWGNSLNVVSGLRAGRQGLDSQWRQRSSSLFTFASRPHVGPTQPPIQGVPGVTLLRLNRPGVKLTTHFHLMLRF